MDRRVVAALLRAAGALSLLAASACSAAPGCFEGSRVTLPDQRLVLQAVNHGQSGRDLAAAVFEGDQAAVRRLLGNDPALRTTHVPPVRYPDFAPDGQFGDLLTFAVARCDRAMVETLLALGVPADGAIPGSALDLALRSRDLALAETLLAAGARPDPAPGSTIVPLLTAGRQADPAAARLLLRYKADPNWRDPSHTTILQTIVDMDSMRVAEVLVEAGADPWAVSAGGALPARGIHEPLRLTSAEEEAARARLIARIRKPGAPWPPPEPSAVRAMLLENRWPPPGSKLPPAPPEVVAALGGARH